MECNFTNLYFSSNIIAVFFYVSSSEVPPCLHMYMIKLENESVGLIQVKKRKKIK